MAEQVYRKLTPKRRGVLRFSQAWLAEDHLLVVVSEWFRERYQRFALADIQAIVVADGPKLRVGALLAASASAGWMAITFAVSSTAAKLFFSLTGVAVLGLAVRALARPRSCYCMLQTSVSRLPLYPVCHRGIATDFLAAISGPIEEAQKQISSAGRASGPTLPSTTENSAAPGSATDQPLSGGRPDLPPPEIRSSRNYMGESLFGILLGDALLMGLILGYPQSNLTGLMATVFTAEALLAGMTLFHGRSKLSLIPGALVIVCVVALLADIFAVSGVAGVRALMAGPQNQGGAVMFGSFWLSPMGTLWFATGWRVTAGLLGLTLLVRERRSKPA
jgi:hypothetical protein